MGTLFAGFLRVPLTSVFMVLEVSGNYSIILPVIISNAIAYLISLRFQETSIFDVLSRQEGLELPSMEEMREGQALRVEDAMRPPIEPVLLPTTLPKTQSAKSRRARKPRPKNFSWCGFRAAVGPVCAFQPCTNL